MDYMAIDPNARVQPSARLLPSLFGRAADLHGMPGGLGESRLRQLPTGSAMSNSQSRMELVAMTTGSSVPGVGVVVIAIMSLVGLVSACGGQDAQPTSRSVAMVVGDRSNSRVPAPGELVGKLVAISDFAPGSVNSVVQVDGSQDGVALYNKQVPQEKNDFEQKRVPDLVKAEVRRALESAKPAEPEANTLGAISSGARTLRDAPGDKTLLVADSMLSTAGVLQFQSGLLDSTPEDVVASVKKEELPDLSGVDVEIYGAGEVRDPQGALTESKRKRLEAIWNQLLKQAGAKSVTFHSGLAEKKDVENFPPVTVIAISQQVAAAPPAATCEHVLTEQTIQFIPDTAQFVDESVAKETISAVTESMNGCSGTVSVIGTTSSWGDEAGRQRVSQDRANTVRDLLAAEMGVPTSTIVARGVGMNFPEYVNDRDAGGRLIPAEAARNRTVRISEM